MTKDGLIAVAKYYGVNDEWNNATSGQPFSIKYYYELLLMVKKLLDSWVYHSVNRRVLTEW
jgi:hypothetical protein